LTKEKEKIALVYFLDGNAWVQIVRSGSDVREAWAPHKTLECPGKY
jgi:hypothetical protein